MSRLPEKITELAEIIKQNGGRAMLVGGCVRDELLNIEPKDWDVEVYGVEPRKLREILESLGKVDAVGEAFTVYKLGNDLDVSLPRREKKIGRGHKGFVVEGDKDMSFEEAAKRRDFTINAILKDVLTGKIVDVYGGREDIKNKILRVVSRETFAEDSLRVLRAAQFAARFEFDIEPETIELCRRIDLTDLPKERIWGELEKLLLKAQKPSIGLKWLYELNVVEQLFPEMKSLVGVPQESEWHPEGWVFSALPFESFAASVAKALGVNRSLFSLRQFVAGSVANAATAPTSDGAMNTQTSDAFFADLETADRTGSSNVFPAPETSPTITAESESLVWSFGIPAVLTDEVVRVVFKILLNRMRPIVFSAVDDFEIVRGIVQPVAVFVMNMLAPFEFASENQFHNQTMNSHSSVFTLPTGVSVSAVIVNSRTSAVDDDVFFYFDLSFVENRDFVHRVKNSFSSNCFEVELGDVFYHTMLVADEARKLIDDLSYAKKVTVMLGALCHDFGKPAATKFFEGRWRSHAHDEAGVAPTVSFLDKLGIFTLDGYNVRSQIEQLVRHHLRPGEFYNQRENLGDGAFRRLARKVEPDLLYRVSRADTLGRNADWLPPEKRFDAVPQEWFIEKAKELSVEETAPLKLLQGRHLIELGLKPSPKFGEIITAVYELQLDGKVTDLDEAINEAKKLIV
ncbi:MAG TPA: HD domain-containing protein [Pyrinomonadaceae bacterium]|nr:HD domain-containing protein [Pyrinomonadaceae bacterium]